jgi:hypothetical protein
VICIVVTPTGYGPRLLAASGSSAGSVVGGAVDGGLVGGALVGGGLVAGALEGGVVVGGSLVGVGASVAGTVDDSVGAVPVAPDASGGSSLDEHDVRASATTAAMTIGFIELAACQTFRGRAKSGQAFPESVDGPDGVSPPAGRALPGPVGQPPPRPLATGLSGAGYGPVSGACRGGSSLRTDVSDLNGVATRRRTSHPVPLSILVSRVRQR